MQPVSIVVTVLNEAQDIGRVVATLLAQNPPAAEVVVVDGGSTDGTWEWLVEAQRRDPHLRAIRDESCNLKRCAGPISRGRNVAISLATSDTLACADAGCTYAPEWLANLTAPLAAGQAEYALGGSTLDPQDATIWDVASAAFFGVRLSPTAPTKSCTARSMAFTRAVWQRVGGFPETVLVAEDSLFDAAARRLTPPAFVDNAKALYAPQNSFRSAAHQMARYAYGDGQTGIRWARLFRNALRCLAHLAALACLPWSIWPFVIVFLVQAWVAYERDGRDLLRFGPRAILARFAFAVAVPWIVTVNQLRGRLSKQQLSNRQNIGD
ncbi:MAG: glycosyltransferase [Acidobacteriota bacterium]